MKSDFRNETKMVEMNNDIKTMGLAINLQRMFNPLVEAATMRLQDPQLSSSHMAEQNISVSLTHRLHIFPSSDLHCRRIGRPGIKDFRHRSPIANSLILI